MKGYGLTQTYDIDENEFLLQVKKRNLDESTTESDQVIATNVDKDPLNKASNEQEGGASGEGEDIDDDGQSVPTTGESGSEGDKESTPNKTDNDRESDVPSETGDETATEEKAADDEERESDVLYETGDETTDKEREGEGKDEGDNDESEDEETAQRRQREAEFVKYLGTRQVCPLSPSDDTTAFRLRKQCLIEHIDPSDPEWIGPFSVTGLISFLITDGHQLVYGNFIDLGFCNADPIEIEASVYRIDAVTSAPLDRIYETFIFELKDGRLVSMLFTFDKVYYERYDGESSYVDELKDDLKNFGFIGSYLIQRDELDNMLQQSTSNTQ